MDRELLGRIQSAIPIVAEAEEHSVEIEKWQKKINSIQMEQNISEKPGKVWIVIALVVANFATTPLLPLALTISNGSFVAMFAICLVTSVVVTYAIYKLLIKLIWKSSHNKEAASHNEMLAKYNQEIAVHQNEINRITSQNIELLETLPPDYLYVFALNSLSDILINRRADTLKEALAVYEDDVHKQAMRDGQDDLFRRQNVLEQAIGDVSDMAYSAQQRANSAYYRN